MTKYLTTLIATMTILAFSSADAELIDVDNTQLESLIADNVTIIDVRMPDEWKETGVIQKSHPMTFFDEKGQYDAKGWVEKLSKVSDKSSPVILICHSGSRSKMIGTWLSNAVGYEKVYNVTEGIESWIKSGRPTVAIKPEK